MLTSEKLGDLPMPSKMEADIRTEGKATSMRDSKNSKNLTRRSAHVLIDEGGVPVS